MLRVIVKTINVVTACYVVYLVGGAIYEFGKDAGKKELASEFIEQSSSNDNPSFKIIDGVLYKRVDK